MDLYTVLLTFLCSLCYCYGTALDEESLLEALLPKRSDRKDDSCEDLRRDCSVLRKYCAKSPDKMKTICRKTCGYCGTPCEDLRSDCSVLRKYCTTRLDKLKTGCRKTCGYCGDITVVHIEENPAKPTKQPVCKDKFRDCHKIAKIACTPDKEASTLKGWCDMTCGYCRTKPVCKDKMLDCHKISKIACTPDREASTLKGFCDMTCGYCLESST